MSVLPLGELDSALTQPLLPDKSIAKAEETNSNDRKFLQGRLIQIKEQPGQWRQAGHEETSAGIWKRVSFLLQEKQDFETISQLAQHSQKTTGNKYQPRPNVVLLAGVE